MACLRFLSLLLTLGTSGLAHAQAAPAVDPAAAELPSLRTSGLLQVDAVAFHQASLDELDPATREPLNEDRFLIRRARVRLDGSYGYVRGTIQLDANTIDGGQLRLLAAELSAVYPKAPAQPWVEAGLGLFLLPFGVETQELANQRMFLEASSWVNALFPGRRDLGARVHGQWLFLRYALAVTNGNPASSASLPLRDPNRAKDYVGRLGAEGELAAGLQMMGGVSGLLGTGFHPGSAPSKEMIIVRDVNEDGIVQPSEVQLLAGSPGDASRNFDRYALAADLTFVYRVPLLGDGRVYGELVWAKNMDRGLFVADPIASGRSARELGAMAAVRQYLTRHVELGVRYDRYDGDRDARERQGADIVRYAARISTLAVAVAWTTLPHLRVTLEYDHQQNPFGRSDAGRPTTLASDSLTLRGQLEL